MVTDQVRAVSGLFLILFVPGARVCNWPVFALDGATGHAHRASGSVIGTPREDFKKARSWNRRLCPRTVQSLDGGGYEINSLREGCRALEVNKMGEVRSF